MSHTQFKDTTVLVSEFQYLKSRPHYVRGIKCGTQIGFRPDTTQRPRTFYRLYLFTRVRGYATTVGREQYRLWKVRGAARREIARAKRAYLEIPLTIAQLAAGLRQLPRVITFLHV